MLVQSMPDASPAKWHLAHTTWFFETFVLSDPAFGDYKPFDPDFNFLFNSYYEAVGDRHPRPKRGLLTRPTVDEVFRYRAHVDDAMQNAATAERRPTSVDSRPIIELGMNHEQQHLELLFTDIKHASLHRTRCGRPIANGPTSATDRIASQAEREPVIRIGFRFEAGVYHDRPCRRRLRLRQRRAAPSRVPGAVPIASRPVTCGEFLAFMADGGYERPELWLSDGWAARHDHGWDAPALLGTATRAAGESSRSAACGRSTGRTGLPRQLLRGRRLSPAGPEPGLPTEAEWEVACGDRADRRGTSSKRIAFTRRRCTRRIALAQMFGDVWEWTQSPYVPYPGYRPRGRGAGRVQRQVHVQPDGACAADRA